MHACGSRSLLTTVLSLSTLVSSISLDCSKILDNGVKWDLSKLAGPRSVHEYARQGSHRDIIRNITYTIDLCAPLKKDDRDSCPLDTRICAQERFYNPDTKGDPEPEDSWPIAGEGTHTHGRHLDPIPTRLKDSESGADAEKEGLRISFSGGMHEEVEGIGDVKQKAYIELICDRDWTGLEMAKPAHADEHRRRNKRVAAPAAAAAADDNDSDDGDQNDDDDQSPGEDDDDDEPTHPALPVPDEGSALQFKSYQVADEKGTQTGVLRLEWKTKYACEDAVDQPDDGVTAPGKTTGGLGFFAWFIIIFFLAVSSYLIFGAWLNYTRYGARGWDLLPHGDAVRDVPYLLKDWARRVFGGSRGGIGLRTGNDSSSGSRGGYSAI